MTGNGLYKMVWLLMASSLMTACTGMDAKYRVPDYYTTELIPKHYQPGPEYSVNGLRCSEQINRCEPERSNRWITHRAYPKPYFFE